MSRTSRYEMRRYSAMRNAAAPSVGGDSSAPMPEAASMAPAVSGANPTRRINGHATEPSVTVVATPLPDTVPSRKPASVTERPADRAGLPRRESDIEKSRKNLPAPDRSSTAPYRLNRMMYVTATSSGTP